MITTKLPPENDPPALWKLQNELLKEAESLLGPRDSSKKIYRPDWDDIDGPKIVHDIRKDGAFAMLAKNARDNWEMAVYQLAHETVHLLDQPDEECTNNLEEGAAVRFSLDMMKKYGFNTANLPARDTYKNALRLFNLLGEDPYSIAKECRQSKVSFILIDEVTLMEKSAVVDKKVINELLDKPVMR